MTAMENGRVVSIAGRGAVATFMSRERDLPAGAPALQPADHSRAQARHCALHARRIVDDVGAIERRAKHRRVGHLAAIAATDATIVDRGNRIVLERIVGVLDRERWAAGQTDARVVAGTDVFVDTVALAHLALAAFDRLIEQRLLAPLPVEHAF